MLLVASKMEKINKDCMMCIMGKFIKGKFIRKYHKRYLNSDCIVGKKIYLQYD